MKYKRWIYLALTIIIIPVGLVSRKYSNILPEYVADYSGDTLWSVMVYFGFRFLFPSTSIFKTAIAALLFSYCIEFSQLYQDTWINAIRSTTLGALILGHGFLWTDMICYTAGVLIPTTLDCYSLRFKSTN